MGYFPNGTAGEMFEAEYCSKCVHNTDAGCPTMMAHVIFGYKLCNAKENEGKQILDMLIPIKDGGWNDGCAMFHAATQSELEARQFEKVPPLDQWIEWRGHKWITNGHFLVRDDGPAFTSQSPYIGKEQWTTTDLEAISKGPFVNVLAATDVYITGQEVLARVYVTAKQREVYINAAYEGMTSGLSVMQAAGSLGLAVIECSRNGDPVLYLMPCKM
jgi:hypothetical protein